MKRNNTHPDLINAQFDSIYYPTAMMPCPPRTFSETFIAYWHFVCCLPFNLALD